MLLWKETDGRGDFEGEDPIFPTGGIRTGVCIGHFDYRLLPPPLRFCNFLLFFFLPF